jgi:hypothetical protein
MSRRKDSGQFSSLAGIVALLLAATAMPAHAGWEWATGASKFDEEGKRDWSVEVIPYLWLASLNGELGLASTGTVPVNATFSQLASNLDAGFAGVLNLRFRRWHLLSDNSWVKISLTATPDFGPVTAATLETAVAFGTVGIGYELPVFDDVALDVYLAARWWHISNDAVLVTAGPGGPFNASLTETWASVIVGARVRYRITDRWRVSAVADIGGGGASLDWSVLASVGYDFNDYIGLTAAYRILGVDYSSQTLVYDMRQSGLLLGVNLRY